MRKVVNTRPSLCTVNTDVGVLPNAYNVTVQCLLNDAVEFCLPYYFCDGDCFTIVCLRTAQLKKLLVDFGGSPLPLLPISSYALPSSSLSLTLPLFFPPLHSLRSTLKFSYRVWGAL